MIFTARQVQEECKRQQLYLYQFFINLIKFLQKSPFGNSSDGFVYINVDGADLLSSRVIKSAVDINFENFKPFLVETGGKQVILWYLCNLLCFCHRTYAGFWQSDVDIYIRCCTPGSLFGIRLFAAVTKTSVALIRNFCILLTASFFLFFYLELLVGCFLTT